MEDETRHLQPIHIVMSSVETGTDRYDQQSSLPTTFNWRNNLTALSQRYNLYFVAHGVDIAVYIPSFPFQKLGQTPELIITPTLAKDDARGYIARRDSESHGVNHLLLGDLGSEEILLLSTDSGNVVAYYTKSIQGAVKARAQSSGHLISANYAGIRPFFSEWVQESAWGLAIHREARMIAVSANVPHRVPTADKSAKISVFAFALTTETDEARVDAGDDVGMEDGQSGWHSWEPNCSSCKSLDRCRNYKITLGGASGHSTNIPNISFVNTAEDKYGKWLVSTDLDEQVKVWQVWIGRCHKTWDFSSHQTGGILAWHPRNQEKGWNIAALDPFAFIPVETTEDFCGRSRAPQYHGYVGSGDSYDITNIVRSRVPGNSQYHPFMQAEASESEEEEDEVRRFSSEVFSDDDDDDLDENDDAERLNQLAASVALEASLPETLRVSADTWQGGPDAGERIDLHLDAADSDPESTTGRTDNDAVDGTSETARFEAQQHVLDNWEDESDDAAHAILTEDEDFEDDDRFSASELSTASMSALSRRFNAEEAENERRMLFETDDPINDSYADVFGSSSHANDRLPKYHLSKDLQEAYAKAESHSVREYGPEPFFPLLHCSASHVRLINGLEAKTPHFFCAQILKQYLPPEVEAAGHGHLDRLNMLQTIPELGLVAIATQIGRIALCTLTQKGRDGDYGMRVDHILPTKKQEKAGERPGAPLLGIAVGPIQGRMKRASKIQQDNSWPQDRIFHGIKSTFEPEMVDLTGPGHQVVRHPDDDPPRKRLAPHRMASPKSKASRRRKRSSLHLDEAKLERELASLGPGGVDSETEDRGSEQRHVTRERSGTHPKIKRPDWKRALKSDNWAGIERNRRYRLMITYTDQTVLTYEIWRTAEDVGIATTCEEIYQGARRNLRNRMTDLL